MTDELTEINRRVNNLEYVPSEEPAMTSILWRDPSELKPEAAPVLLKIIGSDGATYYDAASYRSDVWLTLDNNRGTKKIIAWTPLPKLGE